MKLSIIIPAYNEEERIEKTLNSYFSFFNKKFSIKEYEIIVIPNNCSDSTVNILKKLGKKHENLVFKEFKKKIGKAGALIEGFKLAEGNLIGFVDADNSAPPESFFRLLNNINNNDGVIGSRWIKGAEIELEQPLARRILSRIFNLLVRIIMGLHYHDTQCGCKLFKKEAIKSILPNLEYTKWSFDIELLYQMKRINAKIKEIPIKWADDSRTHLNIAKAPMQMFIALIKLRILYSPLKFIMKK
ncbi:glycosyltransferase family 2 protein [Candidatus Woesearchaeota archaeon]|nr:glycosyltransferase family 2 protein [Candidatus Woesearchaeota archaeon]